MRPGWMQYRAISFYWRIYLCVVLGAMITCSLITGALLLGDSLKHSLRKESLARIGSITHSLSSQDHMLTSTLPEKLARKLNMSGVGVLKKEGNVGTATGSVFVPSIQLWGIDEEFGAMSATPFNWEIAPGEVIVNAQLQEQLGVRAGDEIIVRISQQGDMPLESPMARPETLPKALRLKIAANAPANSLGDFQLIRSALPPKNAFVNLQWLREQLEASRGINLILLGDSNEGPIDEERLESALKESWEIADMGLEIAPLNKPKAYQLRSTRVFLEDALVREISSVIKQPRGNFTWFSYGAQAGEKRSPYLFASAHEKHSLKKGEADVLEWLANDLQITKGDSLTLLFPTFSPTEGLLARERSFIVRRVLAMEDPWLAPELMPRFPGLHDAESCREWKPGIDIELDAIREKDEAFWKRHRGAPKVFISMDEAELLWSNPFGHRTSFQLNASEKEALETSLPQRMSPKALGFQFKNVKQHAVESSRPANDLGALFLGFAFILICAALLLAGMIFAFGIYWRRQEFLTLRALGFSWPEIRGQLLKEGAWCAIGGSFLGVFSGMGCTRIILSALASRWRTLVGSTSLEFYGSTSSKILGFVAALLISWFAISLTTRSLHKKERSKENLSAKSANFASRYLPTLGLFGLSALWLTVSGFDSAIHSFGSALLAFIALLATLQKYLLSRQKKGRKPATSLWGMALSYLSRNPSRSLTTVAIVAAGCFLVVAVAANRHDPLAEVGQLKGGTGGFSYYAETVLPIYGHLNLNQDWSHYGLSEKDIGGSDILSFKEKPGDDASCLNQGSARTPGFLGAPWQKLAKMGAFSARSSMGPRGKSPWEQLKPGLHKGEIPVLGDEATLFWGLGLQTGDSLEIRDDLGVARTLRVVATLSSGILQGRLILSEEAFNQLFPSESGYQVFLIKAPQQSNPILEKNIQASLKDHGLSMAPAWKRLALFQNIENTYVSIFQALGFLGLGLGCLGVAVLLLHNVVTRREDLSTLKTMGYPKSSILFMLIAEHLSLLITGTFIGLVAGSFAAASALVSPGNPVPVTAIAESLGWILISGFISTMAFAWISLNQETRRIIRYD